MAVSTAAVSVATSATALHAIDADLSGIEVQSGTSTAGAFPASAPTFDDVRATAPRIFLAVA